MPENELFRDIYHQLYTRGHKPRKIVRVESAGDSLTGDTTVLFVNAYRKAMTAYVGCEKVPKKKLSSPDEYRLIIAVIEGWPVEVPV